MNENGVRAGIAAAAALGLIYALVVGGIGGLDHLTRQTADDWPWLVLVLTGFGAQVGLVVEVRRRQRLHADVRVTASTGAGASVVGMVACCAHHVADLAPVIGASGAAVFLTEYRVPITATGVAINAVGVFLAARRLDRTRVATGR